jgi:rubrerythrin
MPGPFSRWVLRRVLSSSLAFEKQAIDAYRSLRGKLLGSGHCDEALEGGLCHLLEEEELHYRILAEAAAGRLSLEDLERRLREHRYAGFESLRSLEGEEGLRWGPDLEAALEQEEKTWVFYGNLGRISKIPAVRRAFEVLAATEKEHVAMLRRLLGRS